MCYMAHSFSGLCSLRLWALFWGSEEGGSPECFFSGVWEVEELAQSMEACASMGASLGVLLLLITVAPHCEAAQVLIALSGEKLPPCP